MLILQSQMWFMCQHPVKGKVKHNRTKSMDDDWYRELEFYPLDTRLKLLALRIAQLAFRSHGQG